MTLRRFSGVRRHGRGAGGRGFTLIEVALATVIIGVAVVALIEAHQTFLRSNNWSTNSATGTYLANEVREMMRRLPKHDAVTGLTPAEDGGVVGWGPETGEVGVLDFDDLDDFDGIRLGLDGDLPGPVDAFGNLIPEILADGTVMLDEEGLPVPMRGWSQTVTVEKLDPYSTAIVRPDGYVLEAQGEFGGLAVDRFPLRVTVLVQYQGEFDSEPRDVATVVWVAP